jgi:hypothetical protein
MNQHRCVRIEELLLRESTGASHIASLARYPFRCRVQEARAQPRAHPFQPRSAVNAQAYDYGTASGQTASILLHDEVRSRL